MKRLPVRWTTPAYADLFEILEFVASDRPDAARRLGRELLKQSKTLGGSALRGRIVPELLQQGITVYREILVSRYRLIYHLHPEAVQVAAVMDASRDVGEVLLRRLLR
ncbi:MAG: type II toxin-antitoxin system RelE/ParE family toxin [Bryobacteraceae bacterium]